MKSIIIIALTLVYSVASLAKIPATEAFDNILTDGDYVGTVGKKKCLVTIKTQLESVTLSINTASTNDTFVVLNSSPNYSVNEVTGEISASQNLKYPHYLQGGTKFLNVRTDGINQVNFSISTVLLDHRGNDASTYSTCNILL